ncbi:hypothetical protein F5Y14DRAFT_423197 [Nemania sp. NC0429]|nr:hypothetical protein F5Y14DRAFT_423197 [Nemania sp. NC0429]
MSVEIWPPIAPEQLKIEEDATQARELTWLLQNLQSTLLSLKHGLEECYALLAPIDPGSTLVLSTPRAELVKGHVTRVGTRLVKGTIHTRLRTTSPQTLSINPARPIHLAPLAALNTILTQAVDLASVCCGEAERARDTDHATTAALLSSQLRLLAQGVEDAAAILKGTPPAPSPPAANTSRPSTAVTAATMDAGSVAPITHGGGVGESDWTQDSAAATSFTPALGPALSFHVTIHDACLVLHLRALEPADAPVNLGIKLALAIGTARRLEHDEAERVFSYVRHESDPRDPQPYPTRGSRGPVAVAGSRDGGVGHGGGGSGGDEVERVYVREKVRVESADPSLLSMSTKLSALSNTLSLARRNLATVMGEESLEA